MRNVTSYTEKFKLTLVKLVESGRPTKELSHEYRVGKRTNNNWRRAYRKNGNNKVTVEISFEQKRIRELERQLAEANLERDMLKKAMRIFSNKD